MCAHYKRATSLISTIVPGLLLLWRARSNSISLSLLDLKSNVFTHLARRLMACVRQLCAAHACVERFSGPIVYIPNPKKKICVHSNHYMLPGPLREGAPRSECVYTYTHTHTHEHTWHSLSARWPINGWEVPKNAARGVCSCQQPNRAQPYIIRFHYMGAPCARQHPKKSDPVLLSRRSIYSLYD